MGTTESARTIFCGPWVLAAVSGCTVDMAEAALGHLLGVEPEAVEGVKPGELEQAAARLGVRLVPWLEFKDGEPMQPTLGQLDERWIVPGTHVVFIGKCNSVEAPAHYVVVDYREDNQVLISDNMTAPVAVECYTLFAASPVRIVWRVTEQRSPARI